MSDNQSSDAATQQADAIETQEWLESLDWVLDHGGRERVRRLLEDLQIHARKAGVELPFEATTPHINTIPVKDPSMSLPSIPTMCS